jgi:hypothetical protein
MSNIASNWERQPKRIATAHPHLTAAACPGRLSPGYDRRFAFTDNRCLAFADVRRGRRRTEIGRESGSSLYDSESQWGFHYLGGIHHGDSERYRGPEGQKLFHVSPPLSKSIVNTTLEILDARTSAKMSQPRTN